MLERELGRRLCGEPAVGVDRARPRRGELHLYRRVAVEHLGLLHQAKAEMGQAGEQLPERAWIDDIEIKFAVIDRGVLSDGQSAAVIATVANADLVDRRRPARRVIDFQVDKERLKSPRRLHQADGISEHTPGSLERHRLSFDHL